MRPYIGDGVHRTGTYGIFLPSMPRKRKLDVTGGHWGQRQKLLEEYARLDREIESLRPKLLRHEKLREVILEWYRQVPGEEEITVPGITCDVLITARDRMRAVSLEGRKKLFKLWGAREFVAKVHVYLKSLPDPEDELGLYTVQARTGPRHLHCVARASAAQPSAAA